MNKRLLVLVLQTNQLYNIKPTKVSKEPIRLIDTAGFGDTKGEKYDKQITDDIKELFTNKIDYLNAVCLIFKATETRAHDRAKQILDKLFLLFEKGIKDNIIIIFTFVDDFENVQNLTAFKTLNDENSPFKNILGPIEKLPHFEFNKLAYYTGNLSKSYEYNKCRTNFDNLLKYAFNLKRFSLKDTKKVLEDRSIIYENIKDICMDMTDVIQRIAMLMRKRNNQEKDRNRLELLKESDNVYKIVEQTIKVAREETYDDYFSSGWYVLYCVHCSRICHRNYKGPKEGWHSDEYGCNMIYTLGCKCKICDCHYKSHSFHNYETKTRIVFDDKTVKIKAIDPEKKATEEQKKKQREDINKDLEKNKKEI